MPTTPSAAAGAYTSIANIADNMRNEAGRVADGADKTSFGDVVDAVLSNVAESGAATESKAIDMANGKTDVVDLVTAVAETELAVETLVTVRDRVISAYQEILNMPI